MQIETGALPDGRASVTPAFPDFPHAHTDGKDVTEAFEEAIDLLGSVIARALAEKADVPPPSHVRREQRLVPVPFWVARKLALYQEMKAQSVSNSELARRLGVRETVVRRMLDPDRATRPEKLQTALEVLGKHLSVQVRDAA
jgi:antitoxin HicB